MTREASGSLLGLRDRAVRYLTNHGRSAEDDVLRHVYGGVFPPGLRLQLAGPLLEDARLRRQPDGTWALRELTTPSEIAAFTALAVMATGPTPGRARVVRIVGLHIVDGRLVERFDATLNPETHVPRYVSERVGVEPEALNDLPTFERIVDALSDFIGERPILAQDAELTWAFLDQEARLFGRILVRPALVDLNQLAHRVLRLSSKPSLSVVARRLHVSSTDLRQIDEEARVLAAVGSHLVSQGVIEPADGGSSGVLRRGSTARGLPESPGVYVLRDREQTPLYVGKARQLRSRMSAYVHRPLGATRRLEGLVSAVDAVDSTECETDLEALVLEDREIRRLAPRFNTVRQQRAPRYWLHLPPRRVSARGRTLAPPRIELSDRPPGAEGEFVGPFRNETVADQLRALARDVFDLDTLRRNEPTSYPARLADAWQFLNGESSIAESLARRNVALLRRVVALDIAALLLPADPRYVLYAVVRPSPAGVEGFLLDSAVLRTWGVMADDDAFTFARELLESEAQPRTTPDDVNVVLRWFGAQRPPARLLALPADPLAAADAIESAALDLLSRET